MSLELGYGRHSLRVERDTDHEGVHRVPEPDRADPTDCPERTDRDA